MQILNTSHGQHGSFARRFGAILATTGLLLLSACGGTGKDVTQNDLPDYGMDGVPPALNTVTIKMARDRDPKPEGTARLGQTVRIDIVASEALKVPVVTINGVAAEVIGSVTAWYAQREMTDTDVDGEIYFSIVYQDISGELGLEVSATTDGSAVLYCAEGCPDAGGGSLAGDWRLDGEGAASVGPSAGSSEWWASTAANGAGPAERACWFDDVFRFGSDGSFNNVMGDETWIEEWQGMDPPGCGAPVAPHDGSAAGTWEYDEDAGTITITGTGSHLGLAKAVNGVQLADPGAAPTSITYEVLTLDGDSLVVTLETDPGVWWTFRLARAPVSPLAGKWKLDGEGAASVGPSAGSAEWWSSTAANGSGPAERPCWFDDIYEFNTDGSFRNIHGDETWVEAWQGGTDACGAPVAPHDSSNNAIFQYDEDAGTIVLTGLGAYLALPKAVNGVQLTSPAGAPESVTYTIITLDGDSLTVTLETDPGVWWTFNLTRVSNSPMVGKWKLAGEGAASVGPSAGSAEWWSSTAANGAGPAERPCWFDDFYHFGDDGSFQNYHGTETWVEGWQGGADACGAPVAPHDGTGAGSFTYDDGAGTLVIDGLGSYLALPKAVNGQQLTNPGDAPDSITYEILTLDGDNLTVTLETDAGVWWTFNLERVVDTAPLAGKWKLDGEGAASVGPSAGSAEWWSSTAANGSGPAERPCWFDDVHDFGADGSFMNVLGSETWIEAWQGGADACGAPVAPHDGSARSIFVYDEAANTLTIHGTGAHLALPKAVNGQQLLNPGDAPESVTYEILTLDGDSLSVTLETDPGVWWTFNLVRVSNSPLAGNWKLDADAESDSEAAAGVGPVPGSGEWWNATAANGAGPAERACWFDDVFHFGADGTFQNFMGGETWVEGWQGGADACGAPVAPHDGSSAGTFAFDDAAGTLALMGLGSHLGLAKAVNGAQLTNPGDAPDDITYTVIVLDGGLLKVTLETDAGVWWSFRLVKE
jgi:hypothetical protein